MVDLPTEIAFNGSAWVLQESYGNEVHMVDYINGVSAFPVSFSSLELDVAQLLMLAWLQSEGIV